MGDIDKGFQQHWTDVVFHEPMFREDAGDSSENMGGEAGALDPWKNEESYVVYHEVKALFALHMIPSYPFITGC